MSAICIGIIAYVALCAALFFWWIATAPEGWEDDAGFHRGRR